MAWFFCRHTFDVESVNALRLSYLPKRTSFGFEAMEARGKLVVLDHNFHLHRGYKRFADGTPQLHRSYNSRSKKERACLVKESKHYPYIEPIVQLAMHFALHGTPAHLCGPSFDPKKIAPTIRGPGFVSTPTQALLEKHVSRFYQQ